MRRMSILIIVRSLWVEDVVHEPVSELFARNLTLLLNAIASFLSGQIGAYWGLESNSILFGS